MKENQNTSKPLASMMASNKIQEKIEKVLIGDRKYLDKEYSAKKLAAELGTNTRYISEIIRDRFHCNFALLVNSYRIRDAMRMLEDPQYRDKSVEEIAHMAGYTNRQTFYNAFHRIARTTPRKYRMEQGNLRQQAKAKGQ